MSSNRAAVIVFTYNRPKHLSRLLYSLNKCINAEDSELFIFSDYEKKPEMHESVSQVRKIILEFAEKDSVFRNTTYVFQNTNQGLAKSIIEGVNKIIKDFGKVIVLEDDLLVSPDFLTYMNDALVYYENNQDVWAISGYTFSMKSLETYKHDVYFSGRACSWGWATWSDRWVTTDWKVSDYKKNRFNLKNRIGFMQWGNDLPYILDDYMYGKNNSWAVRWCYSAFLQGKYTVYPKISRVSNSGADGSGENYIKRVEGLEVKLAENNSDCEFIPLVIDKEIQREFRCRLITPIGIAYSAVRTLKYRLFADLSPKT